MVGPIEVIQTMIEIPTHGLSTAHINKNKISKKFDKTKRGGTLKILRYCSKFYSFENDIFFHVTVVGNDHYLVTLLNLLNKLKHLNDI